MTTPETTLDPLTAFGVGNRRAFGGLLLVIGLVIGLAGGYACSKGYALGKPVDAKAKDGDPADTAKKEELKGNPTEWYLGGAIGIVAGLVCIGFGLMQLTAEPISNIAQLRGDIRMAILLVGGSLGLLLMLFGGVLFALRLDSLNEWLNLGRTKGMLPVVSAVAVSLVGLAIAFLSIIPARGEDRVNPTARRLVHGANAVLSGVILLGLLVGLNCFLAVKMPVKLDTTASGFYTLDPRTVEYLQNLTTPITIYSTIGPLAQSKTVVADIEKLLDNVQRTNPAKITVRHLSPTTDINEINTLIAKYPSQPLKQLGVLITVANDDKRASFLSTKDFFNERGEDQVVFEGEGKLIRELLFLADNNNKTIIYVTQGSGELQIAKATRRTERSFSVVCEKLKQINCEIRPLVVDPRKPMVPGDASLVVVADPLSMLPPETVQAISEYVFPADPKAKAGRFLILSGPNPSQDGKTMQPTGLEPILNSLGLSLGNQQIFSDPDRDGNTLMAVIAPSETAQSAIAKDYQGQLIRFFLLRPIAISPEMNPGRRAEPLFATQPGRRTFLDAPDVRGASLLTWQEMQRNPDLQRARSYGPEARPVAVTVEQGKSVQGIVIGTGMTFSDGLSRGDPSTSLGAEIFANMVDTLRDRPAVASLATKQYGMYKPPPVEQFSKAFWLPVLLTPLAIASIGIGVWVVRRR